MYSPDVLKQIIKAALQPCALWTQEAEDLLLETCCQESGLGTYLHQINGPALGIYQMEPVTLFDRWKHYISKRGHLVLAFRSINALEADTVRLTYDPIYSTLMARIKYLPVRESIPTTREGRAQYWKDHYNTHLGAGTVEAYLKNCSELLGC